MRSTRRFDSDEILLVLWESQEPLDRRGIACKCFSKFGVEKYAREYFREQRRKKRREVPLADQIWEGCLMYISKKLSHLKFSGRIKSNKSMYSMYSWELTDKGKERCRILLNAQTVTPK